MRYFCILQSLYCCTTYAFYTIYILWFNRHMYLTIHAKSFCKSFVSIYTLKTYVPISGNFLFFFPPFFIVGEQIKIVSYYTRIFEMVGLSISVISVLASLCILTAFRWVLYAQCCQLYGNFMAIIWWFKMPQKVAKTKVRGEIPFWRVGNTGTRSAC